MAFPCPFADSLDPMDLSYTFDVSKIIPKNMPKFLYVNFKPFLAYIRRFDPKTAYIGMCAKGQILLEFSLTWIRLTCLLAFHMPWDCSDSTLHFPIEELYKEPFGYIEEDVRIESKETIVHCCQNLYLTLHPFVPWITLVFFPILPFACELAIERWRIEVVEAQVGDSVSPIRRRADRGCHYCNLCFISIEISSPIQ